MVIRRIPTLQAYQPEKSLFKFPIPESAHACLHNKLLGSFKITKNCPLIVHNSTTELYSKPDGISVSALPASLVHVQSKSHGKHI